MTRIQPKASLSYLALWSMSMSDRKLLIWSRGWAKQSRGFTEKLTLDLDSLRISMILSIATVYRL